jgi:two-component system, LytTR family, sensor histidine kinase AlgZ
MSPLSQNGSASRAALSRSPGTEAWLPNFCDAKTVLMLMLTAQVVAAIAVLAPSFTPVQVGFWATLGPASVLAHWLALTSSAALCLATPLLNRMAAGIAAAAAIALVACNAFTCSWLSFQGLRLMYPEDQQLPSSFLLRVTGLSILVTMIALRYMYMQHQWQRQVQANARVQVQALTARIRPHFLFNTLNTATTLISIDAERAERVLVDLSELFRAALKAGDEPITLSEELDLAKGYLAIEQLRLGPRLKVVYHLDDAPLNFRLPPLLLQPLVENAVYHGIQPRVDGGTVTVSAKVQRNRLTLSVHNPKAEAAAGAERGNGLAHANISARLRYAFPADATQHYAKLEIIETAHDYTAQLSLPL